MNEFISGLVAVLSVALVVGAVLWGINHVMGNYAILAWVGLAWVAFITVMKAVNS